MASPSVEVKCLDTFAYYPAFLKDFNNADQVLVSYPNAWKPDEWVLLENVRNAAPPFEASTFAPVAGDTVEAQAKSSDDEPYSWWKATVRTVRGEFYMISYSSWEDEFNEILEKDMLRPYNKNPSLKASDIKKLELALPRDLRESGSLDVRALNQVLESSGALSVHVDPKKAVLVILGNAHSVKRAQLLAGMAFKHLGEIQRLKERTEKHQQHLNVLKQRLNEGHLETFNIVPADLIGLVIGVQGKNIRRVEKMPGVLNVRVDSGKSQVSILAKSEAEAKAAREQLEFIEARYPILKREAGRVVGTKFSNMDQIQKDSGVVRIRLDQKKEASAAPDASVDLIITGTKESVADALLLLNHHMEFLSTVNQLAEDERELNNEVRKMNIEAGVYEQEQRYSRVGLAGRGARGPRPQGNRQYTPAGQNDFPPLPSSNKPRGGQDEERKEGSGGRGGRGGGRGGRSGGQGEQRGEQRQQQQQQGGQNQGQQSARGGQQQGERKPRQQQQGQQGGQGQQQQQQPQGSPQGDDGQKSGRGRGGRGGKSQGGEARPQQQQQQGGAPAAAVGGAAAGGEQKPRRERQPKPQGEKAAGSPGGEAGSPSASPDSAKQKKERGQGRQRRERQPAGDGSAAPAPAAAAAAPASSPSPAQ